MLSREVQPRNTDDSILVRSPRKETDERFTHPENVEDGSFVIPFGRTMLTRPDSENTELPRVAS